MGNHRNFTFGTVGYNGAFPNVLIGIARRDYIRVIKKEVIGILDLSLPISEHFFTRHVLRKGFQLDLYKHKSYKIPFMFATSSISRRDPNKHFTDITAEFTINPGIYHGKYTIAFDWKYELIAFRYSKFAPNYVNSDGVKPKNKFSHPPYDDFKIGVIGGYNIKNMTFYLKTGYERNPFRLKSYLPGYILVGFGYKFGEKPFKHLQVKETKN